MLDGTDDFGVRYEVNAACVRHGKPLISGAIGRWTGQVGVFAGRGPRRPNRIRATICEIVKITGHQLTVRGLDAIVGTPILDIKPVMRELLPRAVRQPAWVDILMRGHFAP